MEDKIAGSPKGSPRNAGVSLPPVKINEETYEPFEIGNDRPQSLSRAKSE